MSCFHHACAMQHFPRKIESCAMTVLNFDSQHAAAQLTFKHSLRTAWGYHLYAFSDGSSTCAASWLPFLTSSQGQTPLSTHGKFEGHFACHCLDDGEEIVCKCEISWSSALYLRSKDENMTILTFYVSKLSVEADSLCSKIWDFQILECNHPDTIGNTHNMTPCNHATT